MLNHYISYLRCVTLTILSVLLLGLTGCQGAVTENTPVPGTTNSTETHEGNTTSEGGTTASPHNPWTFSLPSGWEMHDEIKSKARWPYPSQDGKIPYVVLELMDSFEGTAEEAKTRAMEKAENFKLQCESNPDCTITPSYQEFMVGNQKVYAALGENFAWGSSSWWSLIYLIKDGRVFVFTLDDQPQYYKEALEELIATLH